MILRLLIAAAALRGVAAPVMPGAQVPAIKVDTVGYPVDWPKVAFLNRKPDHPALVDSVGARVYEIRAEALSEFGVDPASKDKVWRADFSAFDGEGSFRLQNGSETSDPFEISCRPYVKAAAAALKMFYYQRCGVAIKEPLSLYGPDDAEGGYTRASPCHKIDFPVFDLERYPEKVAVPDAPWGGWHDAGNHDMYVPSTALSALIMLDAAERGGRMRGAIMDEALFGAAWVRRMTLPDGSCRARLGVYHQGDSKAGSAAADRAERWVSAPTSAATAKACALFARLARLAPEKGYAALAKKSWSWLRRHPERLTAGNHGSDQPLWDDDQGYSDISARALAAAEIWASFHDALALEYLVRVWNDPELGGAKMGNGAWGNVSRLALAAVLNDPKTPAPLHDEAVKRVLAVARPWLDYASAGDGYLCATRPDEYYWGSNSNLMEKAALMLQAADLDPERAQAYVDAARDQWHWILGRNPNGFSMVSRVGKGPERIYHLEWGAKSPPPPGYLVGGPNAIDGGFLSPGAPAKALLWDNPMPLKASGLPPHSLWHNAEEDLWEGGFVPPDTWTTGWWVAVEPDIYYNANLLRVAVEMQN